LPVGVALGLSICTVAFIGSWVAALPMLVLIGAIGGLLVVPMNALLQHRGQLLMTAGRSIAVQNFNENISILVMLASYTGLLWLDVAMVPLMVLLGLATSALVGLMIWRERSRPPLGAAPAPA
jgi:LPLT family lysophospholipid transporter-like MFS transporter